MGTRIGESCLPPRDRHVELGEAGVDEHRGVGAQGQVDSDVVAVDHDLAGGVEEVAPQPVGGGQLVEGQLAGKQAVAVAGQHGEGGVEVNVEGQPRGQGVEVETRDVRVHLVLDDHPLGVAAEQVLGRSGQVVGDEQGGLVWPMSRTATWRRGWSMPLRRSTCSWTSGWR